MANFRASAKNFTRIATPYFRGDDRWAGRILLTSVIALQLFQVWLNVKFNSWYNTFYNALQNKDWNVFIYQLGVFSTFQYLQRLLGIPQGCLVAFYQMGKRYPANNYPLANRLAADHGVVAHWSLELVVSQDPSEFVEVISGHFSLHRP